MYSPKPSYFVPSSSKLREDVFGQKSSVASRYVYIDIFQANETIQHRFKFIQQLNFVQQDVIHSLIFEILFQIRVQNVRIAETLVWEGIECNLNDVILGNPFRKQMVFE